MKKKKALITVPRMPYPLNSGGRIAIYDALRLLSESFDLKIIIIDDDVTNKQYLHEIEKLSNEVYFISPYKFQFYLNSLIGLLSFKPLQVGYFYFRKVQKLVNLLAKDCDFFYAFMIRTTSYGLNLPLKKGNYAIDSMYLNYKNSEKNTKSFLWKLIYKIELPLLYATEKHQIRNYDITTFVNREEAFFWKKFGNVQTLPHGVENEILAYNLSDKKYSNVVAFIGRMDYQPNIDAVSWFINCVVDNLTDDVEFWIIGGFVNKQIKDLVSKSDRVKILGFIHDPYVILKSCICTVAPMQTGGGLQTKILMAMAVESIVVCTSLPAKAIEFAVNEKNIFIEDNPIKMALLINNIFANPKKYESIKLEGKKLIKENYALNVIKDKLLNLIKVHLL
jgi:glycosyltransferase involved in cell wall biosynthesis